MSERKEFRDLASPEAAREAIADLDLEPATESVPLADARGRVLAERLDAGLDVPGFDRASMDGYAVRARDTFGADETDPNALELTGVVHAGTEPDVEVEEGTAVEISTGAVMPSGADAVVMVERTDEHADDVLIQTAVAPGDHVMTAGADIAAGERALGPGTRLTPREIGLLSALGVDSVPVRGKPTVGIVSTGDELVRPGEDLNSDAGQIYDVNSYTVASAVAEAGGKAEMYPHAGEAATATNPERASGPVGDDYDEMESVLRTAADECDLVLSSGSTSASAVDVIYQVIEDRGELLLHGVSVKPGKPMLVGRLDHSAYIGLPGYPVSALTIFRTFVAPAIRRAAGVPEPTSATISAKMAAEERYSEGRTRMLPVGLVENEGGDLLAYTVDKGSGATTSLVEADGVVEVHADTAYVGEGESVEVELFSADVRVPTVLGVGEDDPALARLLDELERPRYLGVGSREGLRRLRDGLPDFAVTSAGNRDLDAEELGSFEREWGLVVPAENPDEIESLADLVEEDVRFVNRGTDSGLRTTLGNALADLAEERDTTRHELVEAIDGFEMATKAHESPARRVVAGKADAGVGLRATAEKLGLDFVSLGTEQVQVLANPERAGKEGVKELEAVLDSELETVLADLPGYSR